MANGSLTSLNPPLRTLNASFGTTLSIWQGPLVPGALVFTAGIITDRFLSVPLLFSFLIVLAGLIAWTLTRLNRQDKLSLIYLALAGLAFGAFYHHWQRDTYSSDDIGNFATGDPQPVRLRGVIAEEPEFKWHPANDPLRSFASTENTRTVIGAFWL